MAYFMGRPGRPMVPLASSPIKNGVEYETDEKQGPEFRKTNDTSLNRSDAAEAAEVAEEANATRVVVHYTFFFYKDNFIGTMRLRFGKKLRII